jgi:3-oxoadipate enol-lactonase
MSVDARAGSGYLEVEGARIWYEVAGDGLPLLLIHAGVADSSMWDDQWSAFAARHRVVRYDARGFGKTTMEDVAFSNRDDILRLLQHLGIDRTAVLGISRGGTIGIDFALKHPERVTALIAVAAGVSGFEGSPTADEIAVFEAMEQAWNARDFERLADLDVRLWVDGPGQSAGRAAAQVREQVRRMCLNNYRAYHTDGKPQPLDPPAAGRLHQIRVPTLVIVGDLDTSATLAIADQLAREIPGARKIVFEKVAHMVNMEQPARFNQVVLDFLADV